MCTIGMSPMYDHYELLTADRFMRKATPSGRLQQSLDTRPN